MSQDLKQLIENEKISYLEMNSLRSEFTPELFSQIRVNSREQALYRGQEVIYAALEKYNSLGLNVLNIDPGHGAGHLIRDYVNAVTLLQRLNVNPQDLFVGIIAGTLHDTGCSLIERYSESQRAVRHAEVGALLFRHAFENNNQLNDAEKTIIPWAIAAHTQYLKPSDVTCSDGETRHVEPYQDLDKNKKPLLGIWLPRFIDRLDCNGPTFVGRHYLTLNRDRKEFIAGKFADINYSNQLRPLIRSREEITAQGSSPTMLEHFKMYTNSQSNDSPYGKHDFGEYVLRRETSKNMLQRIIQSAMSGKIPEKQEENILSAWDLFLANNIEPSPIAQERVKVLRTMFSELDNTSRQAWLNGFLTTMQEYTGWAQDKLQDITKLTTRKDLPTITEDISKAITPNPEMINLIA